MLIFSVHKYATRHSRDQDLFASLVQATKNGIRSICSSSTNVWNSLPINVKQIAPFFQISKKYNEFIAR